jgi:hypothetical protein
MQNGGPDSINVEFSTFFIFSTMWSHFSTFHNVESFLKNVESFLHNVESFLHNAEKLHNVE